jgi:hypothetical protein
VWGPPTSGYAATRPALIGRVGWHHLSLCAWAHKLRPPTARSARPCPKAASPPVRRACTTGCILPRCRVLPAHHSLTSPSIFLHRSPPLRLSEARMPSLERPCRRRQPSLVRSPTRRHLKRAPSSRPLPRHALRAAPHRRQR